MIDTEALAALIRAGLTEAQQDAISTGNIDQLSTAELQNLVQAGILTPRVAADQDMTRRVARFGAGAADYLMTSLRTSLASNGRPEKQE